MALYRSWLRRFGQMAATMQSLRGSWQVFYGLA